MVGHRIAVARNIHGVDAVDLQLVVKGGDLDAAAVSGDGKPVAVVGNRDRVDAVGLDPIAVAGDRQAGAVAADGKRVVLAGHCQLAVAAVGLRDHVVEAGNLQNVGPFDVHVTIESRHREAGAVANDPDRAVVFR